MGQRDLMMIAKTLKFESCIDWLPQRSLFQYRNRNRIIIISHNFFKWLTKVKNIYLLRSIEHIAVLDEH